MRSSGYNHNGKIVPTSNFVSYVIKLTLRINVSVRLYFTLPAMNEIHETGRYILQSS